MAFDWSENRQQDRHHEEAMPQSKYHRQKKHLQAEMSETVGKIRQKMLLDLLFGVKGTTLLSSFVSTSA
jgi:hypothetical protein